MPDWFPPSEPTYGDDCAICYDPGLTPIGFNVSFAGIEKGALWAAPDGQPPNGTYYLPQVPVLPCLFGEWPVAFPWPAFEMGGAQTLCSYYVTAVIFAFRATPAQRCLYEFVNSLNVPAGNHFYGGTATVIPPWEVDEIVEDVTPIVDPDPLLQIVSMANNRAVVSYIDEWGDTKLKILVDFTLR